MKMRPLWFWCLFCAVTMSLGWGLRGSIGGGSLGAMIPGAMIGLALCLLLGRERDAGLVAALAAIGVGFGGQETYGQTVSLILRPESFSWAFIGFAIKGAAWGLLGGAFIGIALVRDRLSNRQLMIAFALMVAWTWGGWKFLNEPKLVYFSNLVDKPREELWAGLWLGGLFLLAWIRSRVPSLFALYGAIGGGIGFAFGAALQPWGKGIWPEMPLGWWKAMELTFGAVLGLAYALCAWKLRKELARPAAASRNSLPLLQSAAAALAAIALAMFLGEKLSVRFSFTVAGAILAALVLFSETLAWQTAITATYAAFTWDMFKKGNLLTGVPMWAVLVVTATIVMLVVARRPNARTMFLLLTWTAVANAFRYLLAPARSAEPVTMLTVFVLCAVVMTVMVSASLPEADPTLYAESYAGLNPDAAD